MGKFVNQLVNYEFGVHVPIVMLQVLRRSRCGVWCTGERCTMGLSLGIISLERVLRAELSLHRGKLDAEVCKPKFQVLMFRGGRIQEDSWYL